MNKYIEEFSEYLTEVKKSSENTRLSYIRDINQFESYLTGEGIEDIQKFDPVEFAGGIVDE